MTISRAIEIAVYELIKTRAIGEGTLVRCWHGMRTDSRWDEKRDRILPSIDIRCYPPVTDDNKVTLTCQCAIDIRTLAEQDRTHERIEMIEDAVQSALDELYSQFRAGATGEIFAAFESSIKNGFTAVQSVGGLELSQGTNPSDDDGANTVGMVLGVQYSRADF